MFDLLMILIFGSAGLIIAGFGNALKDKEVIAARVGFILLGIGIAALPICSALGWL